MRGAKHGRSEAQHSLTCYAIVDNVAPKCASLSMQPLIGRTYRAMPDGLEHKLHLLARRLLLPHPRGGAIDVTAPLPPHMHKSSEVFVFDVKRDDPIEDAPEE